MTMPTRSQLKKNLKALHKRLEGKPMDLDARMRAARTHRLLSNKKEAVAHYRTVARYLSLSGQPLQAIAVLKELLQVDPDHEETLMFLAKLYARTRAVDATNRGRVAVPILDDADGPLALPEGLPLTSTGIWRAIRPQATDVFTVVHEPEEVGADEEVSVRAELEELDQSFELDEADVLEETAIADDGLISADDGAPISAEDLILPKVPLFSSLSPRALFDLQHAMVFQRARQGTVVFKEGDAGDSCLVIAKGRAVAHRKGDDGQRVELMELTEGSFAGVFALMSAQKRQATLTATTDLEYFEIDRLAIAELMKKHKEAQAALFEFFRERLLLNLLAVLPVFSNLSSEDRQALEQQFVDRSYDVDEELFYEGSARNGLWVILSGQVKVDGERAKERAMLASGDYVGSFAEYDGSTADLGAVATHATKVALLPHKTLAQLLEAHPDLSSMRAAFDAAGMMLSDHVFAGNARLPGNLGPLVD